MLKQYTEGGYVKVDEAIEGVEVIEAEEKQEVKEYFAKLDNKQFTPETFTDELIKFYGEKYSDEDFGDDESTPEGHDHDETDADEKEDV
eukprot:CAMPEP_0116982582 /NCGR_PEP_ID=MMETSP0467-20121206/60420_1 /TAXON_ID=283647 /ORGANISM="Mesodinium pulex, Strain SPMC105" /LENGTH=88 /DNA_ID=CAMNT_0004677085 /DNA_START=124 /DNA_END=390 /DNA_ORIENTATION=+